MSNLSLLASAFVLIPMLIIAGIITLAAVRSSRNNYVAASSLVLERFLIQSDALGEPAISITGRHKGIVAWMLTNLGMETRVELTVTEREWTIRDASLAGMSVLCVPLKGIRATICGYQRSLLAFFFAVLFALYALWTVIGLMPVLATALRMHSEWGWENAATQSASSLFLTFGLLVVCGIAGLIYYSSKRVAFGVNCGHVYGIVFKRSFIENVVIDLATAEHATSVLNRLVGAAVYGTAVEQVSSSRVHASSNSRGSLRAWMIASGYAALLILALVLNWYGKGVAVNLTTVPAGAFVRMDGQYVGTTSQNGGAILLPHITRENHMLWCHFQGYEVLNQVITVGGLESSQSVSVKLTPLSYPVTVFTTPGSSHVFVDGKEVGSSNAAGLLAIPKVDIGVHQFTASHEGFRTLNQTVRVMGPWNVRFGLESDAEAARQEAEAARQQAEARQRDIASHLERARMLFRQGQYPEASSECDTVLKSDPTNAAALALKKQIEQTRKILG